MLRSIFLASAVVAVAGLAALGACTAGVIGAVAVGYLPMDRATELLGEAVSHAEEAGLAVAGTLGAVALGRLRPFVTGAVRNWIARRMSELVADQLQKQLGDLKE